MGKLITRVLQVLDGIGVVSIILMMLTTTADVIARKFANHPIVGMTELNKNLLVFVAFLALGYAQYFKQHVRTEMVLSKLSPKPRWTAELVELVFALVITAFFTYGGIVAAYRGTIAHERELGLIPFPMWPGRIALALGLLSLCMQFLVEIVYYLRHPRQQLESQKRVEIV
ncbi:MAG: TRAP transporter small permease [Chloroflexi bacterium]|nr:TRAP transporter small permease [Chloroflexota bacterium]